MQLSQAAVAAREWCVRASLCPLCMRLSLVYSDLCRHSSQPTVLVGRSLLFRCRAVWCLLWLLSLMAQLHFQYRQMRDLYEVMRVRGIDRIFHYRTFPATTTLLTTRAQCSTGTTLPVYGRTKSPSLRARHRAADSDLRT